MGYAEWSDVTTVKRVHLYAREYVETNNSEKKTILRKLIRSERSSFLQKLFNVVDANSTKLDANGMGEEATICAKQ